MAEECEDWQDAGVTGTPTLSSLDSAQLSLSVGAGASFPDSGSERSPQQAADQSSDKKSGTNREHWTRETQNF